MHNIRRVVPILFNEWTSTGIVSLQIKAIRYIIYEVIYYILQTKLSDEVMFLL